MLEKNEAVTHGDFFFQMQPQSIYVHVAIIEKKLDFSFLLLIFHIHVLKILREICKL